MLKKILIALVVLVLLAAAGIYFFGSTLLNHAIKVGVETVGPKMTQTAVTLERAELSVLSGNGSLIELKVGNPEGYRADQIFALGQIDIDLEPSSLFDEVIVINRIYIRAPAISYERKLTTSNLDMLLDNIEAFTGGPADETAPDAEPTAEDAAEEGAAKEVMVKQLVIEEGSVYLAGDIAGLGTGTRLPLPRIELDNIGTANRGATIAQVVSLTMREVLKAIGPLLRDSAVSLGAGGTDLIKATGQGAADTGAGALGGALDALGIGGGKDEEAEE